MNNNANNINYAILGPVSAGKSTFFNALFTQTCSDMKRKKTTMLPQYYQTTSKLINVNSIDEIYERNKLSNEEILAKRENNTFNYKNDFKEIYHVVKPLIDFVNLPDKNATYSILDMPGLNCGGDNMYYEYITSISHKIDIYFVLFDINSGLNTSDEIKIIDLVVNEVKKNNHGYIYFLLNKCDDLEFDDNNNVVFADDELDELYKRSIEIINSKCEHIMNHFYVTPICSSKLYIYRGVKNDIGQIDEKQLDTIIKTVCGTRELKKINSIDKKREFISGLLKDTNKKKSNNELYENWMEETGYHLLKQHLCSYINDNYANIIYHHIEKELSLTIDNFIKKSPDENTTIYVEMVNLMLTFDKTISNVMKVTKQKTIPTSLKLKMQNFDNLTNKFCKHATNSIVTYDKQNSTILDNIMSVINNYCNYLNKYVSDCIDNYSFIKQQKHKIMTEHFSKQFDEDIYNEIKNLLTNEQLYISIETTLTNNKSTIMLKSFYDIMNVITKNKKNDHISTLLQLFCQFLTLTEIKYDDYTIKNCDEYFKMYFMKGIELIEINEKINMFQQIYQVFYKYQEVNTSINNICKLYRWLFIDSIPQNTLIFLEWKHDNNFNGTPKYIYYNIYNDVLKIRIKKNKDCANYYDFFNTIKIFDTIHLTIINNISIEKWNVVDENYIEQLFTQEKNTPCKIVTSTSVDSNSDNDNDKNNDDDLSIDSKNVYKKAINNASKTATKLLNLGKKKN